LCDTSIPANARATVQGTLTGLEGRVNTIGASAEAIKKGVTSSSEAIETAADINKALRSSSNDIDTMNENVHVALADATAEGNLVINATVMDLEGNLEAAFAALKVELRKQKAALDTNVKGAIETMKDEASAPFLVATPMMKLVALWGEFSGHVQLVVSVVWTGLPPQLCANSEQSFVLLDLARFYPPPGHCEHRHRCPSERRGGRARRLQC
jgi:hypothetical protein